VGYIAGWIPRAPRHHRNVDRLKNVLRYLLISAVPAIFLACLPGPGFAQRTAAGTFTAAEKAEKSTIKALDSLLRVSYAGAPADLRKKLGIPGRIDTAATINKHDEGRDTLFAFHFKGASIQLYYAAISARYFLQQANLFDLTRLARLGITAGMTQDQLVGIFEEPYTVDSSAYGETAIRYETPNEATDVIVFLFSSGRLTSVIFFPYVD